MTFRGNRHKQAFLEAVGSTALRDDFLMAVVYLLTADANVWSVMKSRFAHGEINFEKVRFKTISENGYALYSAAKDLYLGTEHLSIADLADEELISPKVYATIRYAIAIRRGTRRLPVELRERRKQRSGGEA